MELISGAQLSFLGAPVKQDFLRAGGRNDNG
jgi:hypothetical protein